MIVLVFLFVGLVSGFLSGLLGIGGGIIVVPALYSVYNHTGIVDSAAAMHVAAGTSFAIMLLTSLVSGFKHYRHQNIIWSYYFKLMPILGLGTVLGGFLSQTMSTAVLKIIFSMFLIYIALKMLKLNPEKETTIQKNAPWIEVMTMSVIGTLSGMIGIGGGTLVVMYLTHLGMALRNAIAIASMITLSVAILGTSTFATMPLSNGGFSQGFIGQIYIPAVFVIAMISMLTAGIGARLAYSWPVLRIKRIFVTVIIIMAAQIFYTGVQQGGFL